MPEQSWEEFVKEFRAVTTSPEYRPFRSILTKTEALIGRRLPEDEVTARALLNVVKFLRTENDAGTDVLSLIDRDTVSRFVQPEGGEGEQANGVTVQSGFTVEGDFKQGNRDFIDRSRSIEHAYFIVMSSMDDVKSNTQSRKTLVPIVPVVM